MKISRRDFNSAMASALTMSHGGKQITAASMRKLTLPASPSSEGGGEPFDFPLPPTPGRSWVVLGLPRKYFMEWLPALFNRTLIIEEWKTPQSRLQWIFTGPLGGFTVEAGAGKVRVF